MNFNIHITKELYVNNQSVKPTYLSICFALFLFMKVDPSVYASLCFIMPSSFLLSHFACIFPIFMKFEISCKLLFCRSYEREMEGNVFGYVQ